AAIIFLEPPVNEIPPSLPPPHDDDDVAQFDITSRVVYAPHWYDGLTLLNKRWNFFNIDYLGVKRGRYPNYVAAIKIGEKAIKECFRNQLASIKEEGQGAIGQHPTLIGEIGIPYDLNGGKSFKSKGNYKDQIKAMDANMYALESNHLNFTLWNYCPDNSHKWGDQWNGEDLSLWSKDDLYKDPGRLSKKPSLSDNSFKLKTIEPTISVSSPGDTAIVESPSLIRRTSGSDSPDGKLSPTHARVTKLSLTSSSFSGSSKSLSSSASSNRSLIPTSGATGISSTGQLGLDQGGRAVIAFCRPFAQKVTGIPLELSFSLKNVTFKFSFKRVRTTEPNVGFNPLNAPRPRKISEPTEIFLPRIHFPCPEEYLNSLRGAEISGKGKKDPACSVTVSAGHWEWNNEKQILYWWTDDDENETQVHVPEEEEEEEGSKARRSQNNNDVFEITVVGKKWAGNTLNGSRRSNGFWDMVNQCCRLS
ncbi:hypothetical protein BGZ65_010138, partial [Modicella reniformis]